MHPSIEFKHFLNFSKGVSFSEMNEITQYIPNEADISDQLELSDERSIIRWTLINDGGDLKKWCKINEDGTTIILTTHYLEEAESLCRNIAIIDQGNLIENTSMRLLLRKIHMETFLLDLEEALTQIPKELSKEMRLVDDYTLEVEILDGQNINDLYQKLTEKNIRVRSMRNKSNRLEQLFVHLIDRNNDGQESL